MFAENIQFEELSWFQRTTCLGKNIHLSLEINYSKHLKIAIVLTTKHGKGAVAGV